MKEVQYVARGYPERAYAKGLVLDFLWNRLNKDIGLGYAEKRFRYIYEQKLYILNPLDDAIVDILEHALKFYRLN
jgi:hypothetical protein